jgi:hypothetical protein
MGTPGGPPALLLCPRALPPIPPPLAARKPSVLRGLFFFTDCCATADLPELFQNRANAYADGELDRASRGKSLRAGRDGRPMQKLGELIEVPFFFALAIPQRSSLVRISELGSGAGDGEILSFQCAQLVLGSN